MITFGSKLKASVKAEPSWTEVVKPIPASPLSANASFAVGIVVVGLEAFNTPC